MNRIASLGVLGIVFGLSGCGDSPLTPDAGVSPAPLPPPVVTAPETEKDKPAEEKPEAQPITFTLNSAKPVYKRGETLTFTMTARNTGKKPIALQFNSGQDFDIVAKPAGKEDAEYVWRWAQGKLFTRDVRSVNLEPDKTLTYTATWDQKGNNNSVLKRGTYSLTATLTANGGIASEPLTISLTD